MNIAADKGFLLTKYLLYSTCMIISQWVLYIIYAHDVCANVALIYAFASQMALLRFYAAAWIRTHYQQSCSDLGPLEGRSIETELQHCGYSPNNNEDP